MRTREIQGYDVQESAWTIFNRTFRLCFPADQDGLLDSPNTLARFEQDEYLPYWGQPWPASALLAEYLLRTTPHVGGRVIEIGAGLGLVSLAAAALGWPVVASDYDEDALRFIRENADRNHLRLAGTMLLDYRQPPDRPCWDCILAADLLYEERLVAPVAKWIKAALAEGGVAMVCDPNRSTADNFHEELEKLGLSHGCFPLTGTFSGTGRRGRLWMIQE